MTSAPRTAGQPAALLGRRRRHLHVTLAVLAAIAVSLTVLFAIFDRHSTEREALDRTTLHARVLEDQLTRSISAAASMHRSLALRSTMRRATQDAQAAEQLLEQQLPGQPFLRSIAIVDDSGRILASTVEGEAGLQVDLDALGRQRGDTPRDIVGPLLPIRELADLTDTRRSAQASALPLLRAAPIEIGSPPLWLVSLINPDFFTTQHERVTADSGVRALIADLHGRVVASAGTPLKEGTDLAGLAPYRRFLPAQEHGAYIDAGSDGQPAVAAFRLSRQWPLLVLAELPLAQVHAEWRQSILPAAGVCAAVLALLAALAWLADRSLRREMLGAREAARLHEEVAASEALQQAILRSALDGIVSIDGEGRIIAFNPAAERIFGRSAADVLGLPMHEFIVPAQHRAAHVAGMERYRATGVGPVLNRRIEIEALRADGEVFPIELAITPVHTGKGQIFTATVRDIGERRRIERALRDSEALLDKVGQIAGIGGWQLDLDTQTVSWTAQTFRLHDLEPGTVPPLAQAIAYYAPDSRPLIEAAVQRAIETDEPFDLELRMVTARGRSIWVRARGAVEHESGRRARVVGTIQDITERRAIDAALRESEERFRSAFEQAAVGMLEQDSEGRILRVNPALCSMLGYGAEEFLSQPVRALLHPDDYAAAEHGIRALFEGRAERFAAERRYRHHDGHQVWGRFTASVMRRADGGASHLLAIIEDVTARRQAEAEVAAARQRELSVGARIQQSLLLPRPDERLPGVWLSVLNQASQGIDGDFFEVMPLSEDTVDVIVGDVMGKGVAAAMLGAATKMQFSRSLAQLMAQPGRAGALPSPAEIVGSVHRAMTAHLQALEAFVTLVYARLDRRSATVQWVGCGHEEPLLLRHRGETTVLVNQHPPLGILDEANYEQMQVPFEPGDGLFFASDGVTDARLPDGSRVGREAVQALVQRLFAEVDTPAAVLHALRQHLRAREAAFDDDLTLGMAVAVDPVRRASRRELRHGLDDIVHVRELVESLAHEAGLDEAQAGLFTVACVEAYTNAVRHTRGAPPDAPVELVVQRDGDALVVEITSLGEPFTVPEPPADTSFDAYPEGGFGVTIMHAAADAIDYRQREGVNTVRLSCRPDPA